MADRAARIRPVGRPHRPGLATPSQRLAEVTGGAVFHDGLGGLGLGGLGLVRAKLAWYPQDVWLYILACQWCRIGQEEAFAGRCAEVGDEIGAAVVAARLVRDIMRLCLLMHRRYPPYSKWLGTAFARLPSASQPAASQPAACQQPASLQPTAQALAASLRATLSASDAAAREQHLCAALEATGRLHNELGLTEPVDATVRLFYERPYRVLDAGRFVAALQDAITDPRIRRLPLTGAVDQWVDSTDALGDIGFLRSAVAIRLQPT